MLLVALAIVVASGFWTESVCNDWFGQRWTHKQELLGIGLFVLVSTCGISLWNGILLGLLERDFQYCLGNKLKHGAWNLLAFGCLLGLGWLLLVVRITDPAASLW